MGRWGVGVLDIVRWEIGQHCAEKYWHLVYGGLIWDFSLQNNVRKNVT